jgi:hypothetical protein
MNAFIEEDVEAATATKPLVSSANWDDDMGDLFWFWVKCFLPSGENRT